MKLFVFPFPVLSQISIYNVYFTHLFVSFTDLLEEPIYEADINPVKAAKTMYKACMDVEQIEFVGLQPLLDLSNELGGWP